MSWEESRNYKRQFLYWMIYQQRVDIDFSVIAFERLFGQGFSNDLCSSPGLIQGGIELDYIVLKDKQFSGI